MSFRVKHLRCAVILGYYKGHAFLMAQLQSILDQEHRNIDIFIGDDASPQRAEDIIRRLPDVDQKRITILCQEKNQGFCQNFLTTLAKAPNFYDVYAFNDQDDVGYPGKISRALDVLSVQKSSLPLLYGSTDIVDVQGK